MSGSRTLTDEQFAAGTTIDGNRLDRAMEDHERRVNNVRKGDLLRRFVQTQFVAGFLPDPIAAGALPMLPFMLWRNTAGSVSGTVPDAYLNPQRMKGVYKDDDLDPRVWTASFYFKHPIVIVDVVAFLQTDTTGTPYANTFTYGAPVPPHRATGDPVNDIDLLLTVDNPWRPEDQAANAVEIGRHNFRGTAEAFNRAGPPGAWPDLQTPHPGGALRGIAIHARDLNIPLHRDSRARLSLVIPHWTGDLPPWGVNPETEQYYTTTMTVLEEVED